MDFNPLHYHLSELRKALVALIPLAFVAISYLLGWVPPIGFETAVLGLIGPVILVIHVFSTKNSGPGDIEKALKSLTAAGVTIATYWTQVPASWDNKLALLIVLIGTFFGVKHISNVPDPSGPPPGS